MARKAKEYVENNEMLQVSDEALDAGHAVTLANEAELMAIKGAYEDDRDLVNQLLGQAQMADAFGKFSLTVRTSKLAFVKENKLYRALKGKRTHDGQDFLSGTWDEFCGLLSMSVAKADEDIVNLRNFGETALESMSRMGIGYRELRQYRRLPDDQKTALIEVAQSGDKDAFLELAEDLIAKHAREKEGATQRISDLEGDLQAKEELLAERHQENSELREKLVRIKRLPPDEVASELTRETAEFVGEALIKLDTSVRAAFTALTEHHAAHGGGDFRHLMAGHVAELQHRLNELRETFNLRDLEGDGTPEWMKWSPDGTGDAPAAGE